MDWDWFSGALVVLLLVLQLAVMTFVQAADPTGASSESDIPEKTRMALEALSRLKNVDLESNPAVKAAVLRVLHSVQGTPQFVDVVRDFKIQGQEPALLEIALKNSTNSTGVSAGRLLVESEAGLGLLKTTLEKGNPDQAQAAAQLIRNINEKRSHPGLLRVLADEMRPLSVRKEALRALAQSEEGARQLLDLAKADQLSAALRLAAASELNTVRWPQIKAQAAELLPLPQGRDAGPLPSIAELVRRSGDPRKGAIVFSRPEVGCNNCHQVDGQGVDFGPKLSDIGTKLGKDALYESILDPSAGISFGYEAWTIHFKNGDEAFGIIASETPSELALKTQNGIVTPYKKADITRREKGSLSIMPSGLQQTMSVQDLVDLIEYLSTLKKPTL